MNTEIEQILNDLESEIQAISIESHTGGYEDRENAIETLNKLKLKLFSIPVVSASFEEGYEKGWREATSEACKEIARNYTPNER